ncbi:tyrosine-type recombinase/integrase [Maritimibacter dapengensis]|uniref:Site-specific integrase n=1 Tax=Maritimibacter dapengensis TaxID=2836868 RepID=A0ABS6T363_9RHOB|nr:site-specific integrase [Maritimibacter dapengensis]MBV7379684.1 site-specific integrase [Maritimibacter dapengensis]
MQKDLGYAWFKGQLLKPYDEALGMAEIWFRTDGVKLVASEPYQLGSKRDLNICPIGKTYSVGHALQDYLNWKRIAATTSTFETLVSLVNYHLVPRISHVPLTDFNGKHFHELALAVMETPPKTRRCDPGPRVPIQKISDDALRRRKKTLNALTSILRGAFDIAWERGELNSDIPLRCLRRVPNVDRPRVVFLDRDECRMLMDASNPDLELLVRAALYTGCRANELIQMRVGDFEDRTRSVYVSSPKGRRSRHIFLPSEGVEFFRALTRDRGASDRLFRKANGRVWGGEYKSYFQAARSKAGLPSRLTFHGLRHTYASQLVNAGASLLVVAEQLGHANTQTVSNTYGHLVTEHLEAEIKRCFEPLVDASITPHAKDDNRERSTTQSLVTLPRLWRTDVSSWPRSNFSSLTGPLLLDLCKAQRPERLT